MQTGFELHCLQIELLVSTAFILIYPFNHFFHIFLSFAYGNEHQLKENNYRTEWQPHDTRSSTTVIGILRFFLFIHTPASQQHNHPLNWLTEHTWIKINPEKKSYYSQNMKLRWEPQANILLSQKAHKLILLVSKIYLNFMV